MRKRVQDGIHSINGTGVGILGELVNCVLPREWGPHGWMSKASCNHGKPEGKPIIDHKTLKVTLLISFL